jgi:hypothetical protein
MSQFPSQEVVSEGGTPRNAFQSRFFQCDFTGGEGNAVATFCMLSTIPAVTYLARSNVGFYMEVEKKKECSFFPRLSPLFSGVAIATGYQFSSSDIVRGVSLRLILISVLNHRRKIIP